MVNSVDINTLNTGRWAGPELRDKISKPVDPPPPVRANQSSKIDRQVPRSYDLNPPYPPPPSVEDEASSLAKEHAIASVQSPIQVEENVQFRGELDQHPILVPVHESNPERRFVHVVGAKPAGGDEFGGSPKKGDGSDDEQRDAGPKLENEAYKANTGRKYTVLPSVIPIVVPSAIPSVVKPVEGPTRTQDKVDPGRRRSRSELPRIETDVLTRDRSRNRSRDRSRERRRAASRNPPARNPSRERSRERPRARSRAPSPVLHRKKSTAYVDQRPRIEHSESTKDVYLSANPTVIKHSTTGRDRAYFDMNHSASSNGAERPRSTVVHSSTRPKMYDDRGERRSAVSYERTKHYEDSPRRSASAIDVPKPSRSYSDRRSEKKYNDESNPRTSRRNISPPRSEGRNRYHGGGSPPRSERKSSPTRSERSVRSERSERRRSPSRRYSERERDRDRDREKERQRDREKRDRERPREPPSRSGSYRSQRSFHNSDESSDEFAISLRSARGPRGSNDPNYLLSPDSINRPVLSSRTSSRRETPLASPRASTVGIKTTPPPSPRTSYTFPQMKERRRGDEGAMSPFTPSPSSPTNTSPQSRHAHIPSLTTSLSLPIGASAAMGAVAAAMSTSFSSDANKNVEPAERMATPMPPPAQRQDSASSIGSQTFWQQQSPYSPPIPQSAGDGFLDRQVASFRQYSEDVSEGRVVDLPVCPRLTPQAGLPDWLTFPQSNTFNICPDCYTGVFAHTEFAHMFVPAPFRPMDKPLACDFGTSAWYRIAWHMTRKSSLPNLQLLQHIALVDAKHQPCSGEQRMTRIWQTVRNPSDNSPVERFQVCGYCAGSIQSLFPNLAGVFQAVGSKGEPTSAVCSMHFSTERLRFLDYFDLLEETSDRALARGTTPDVRRLYEKLRRLSLGDCARDERLIDREWYTIRNFPGITVCQECFEQVVQPEIDRSNPLARQFLYRPQRLRRAACQLYSARMRRHFSEACRANDLDGLIRTVEERQHIETDCKSRMAYYRAQDRLDRAEDYERKWQRYE